MFSNLNNFLSKIDMGYITFFICVFFSEFQKFKNILCFVPFKINKLAMFLVKPEVLFECFKCHIFDFKQLYDFPNFKNI